jgi:diguanylate cyclase (GGDEF)-like protein
MPDSQLPPPPSIQENLDQVIFSARDLAFELLVTKAILRSLHIDQILYVVLSGATSGEGLGFNRGLFLLADDGQRCLRTGMAVGPIHRQEAHRIWEDMVQKSFTLEALLTVYDAVKDDPLAHQLSRRLRHLTLPLDALEALAMRAESPTHTGRAPIEPMLAKCLLERQPLHSRTLELACEDPKDEEPFSFRNWWMVPLLTPERVVGILVVDDAFCDRDVSPGIQHLLVALANLSAIAVEKSKLFDEMRALAQVDGLTGLANRRTYEEAVDRLLTQARQTGRSVSLIVLDIDHFKQFNDRHGHLAGDDALRFVARVLRSGARKTDVISRYGGEEFAILLPDTTYEQALVIADKLVQTIRTESEKTELGRITLCAGVANCQDGGTDGKKLFELADLALYRAKDRGRDRVEGTPPDASFNSQES